MLTISSPTTELPKVGPVMQTKLDRLDIHTVRDLLWHFPIDLNDFSQVSDVVDLKPGDAATVIGRVKTINSRRAWQRRLTIQEAVIEDDTGAVRAIWFNQPYIADSLQKEQEYRFSGKVNYKRNRLQFAAPDFEIAGSDGPHTGRLVPTYPLTRGISHKLLRFWMKHALDAINKIPDDLPKRIQEKYNLQQFDTAIRQIHFPESVEQHEKAKQRIAFDELFTLQLHSLQIRETLQKKRSYSIPFDTNRIKTFVSSLPFQLTNDQRRASFEILKDMERPHPANRLLEGDVGSGKTVCALLAASQVIAEGHQVALLAPTEILATQHYETARKVFSHTKYNIALLTSKIRSYNGSKDVKKNDLLKAIEEGRVDMVIGTHAVIQNNVSFQSLALSIVDEQQRFGVGQRHALTSTSSSLYPHFVSMTATPIPRTLALTIYGELDLSIIREMPKGRKKIITKIVPKTKRKDSYKFMEKELEKGHQIFVILPLIEESEKLSQAKAATTEQKRLQEEVFPKWRVRLLHGKLKKNEKQRIMNDFRDKKIDILVSTSVVEVGVDVPNATVMMIENAERFGLAQLHQFRGRVGRSDKQSYCFLFAESSTDTTKERLHALEVSNDGFELAEKDLEIRGPGEVYGKTQSGYFDALKIARLSDHLLIKQANEAAECILRKDPDLRKHKKLKQRLKLFEERVHLE